MPHDGMIDDVIPDLGAQQSASEPRLAAGTINRVTGTGASVQVWAIIDGFDGYEWGPLEHRPFAAGDAPLIGARCAIGIFSDEKWLVGVDETIAPASEAAFLIGTGAPSSGTGVNGDSYLDRATGLIYAPKAAGVWPAGVPLPYAVQIGSISDYAGPARSIPALWLACFGQSLLRTTYAALFAALNPLVSTVTVTLASPGVWTTPAPHGLVIGDRVFLTTTGALPTGVTANTAYFVMTVPSSTTLTLGTTRTIVAASGAATVTVAVNTSVSQSGVHSLLQSPHGIPDATHFNAPDLRGRVGIGKDTMGGSAASALLWTPADGLAAGEAAHLLLSTESGLVDHTHGVKGTTGGAVVANLVSNLGGTNDITYTSLGSGSASAAAAHNTVPPGVTVEKIIYAGA